MKEQIPDITPDQHNMFLIKANPMDIQLLNSYCTSLKMKLSSLSQEPNEVEFMAFEPFFRAYRDIVSLQADSEHGIFSMVYCISFNFFCLALTLLLQVSQEVLLGEKLE